MKIFKMFLSAVVIATLFSSPVIAEETSKPNNTQKEKMKLPKKKNETKNTKSVPSNASKAKKTEQPKKG